MEAFARVADSAARLGRGALAPPEAAPGIADPLPVAAPVVLAAARRGHGTAYGMVGGMGRLALSLVSLR